MRHFLASGRRRRILVHLGWLAVTVTLALLLARTRPTVPEPADGTAVDAAAARTLGSE